MWEQGHKIDRYDWKVGTMISPSAMIYHQHFNTEKEPVRYLALRYGGRKHSMGESFHQYGETGEQIEYEDEDPIIRKMFMEERKRTTLFRRSPH